MNKNLIIGFKLLLACAMCFEVILAAVKLIELS
jgi:hypothetical protein